MLASKESGINIFLENTKVNKWTEFDIPIKNWYAAPDEDYSFKVAVKKYSNEITNLCWGSFYTYIE